MSIDLSSFSSFALESAPPVAAPTEGQTLTLHMRRAPAPAGFTAMTGTMAIRTLQVATPETQRAAIVAVDTKPFTITFE
jgi:hypothetical protein